MKPGQQAFEHLFGTAAGVGRSVGVVARHAPRLAWSAALADGSTRRRHGRKPYDRGMMPDDIGARLLALLDSEAPSTADSGREDVAGSAEVSMSGGGRWGRTTVDVAPDRWHDVVRLARNDDELALDFFDWLSAVDELPDGFTVVAHLWSTRHRHGVLLRTSVERSAPRVASIVDLFPGASWHERETHEMFGIEFVGHAEPQPLLLPPEFEGHPLRKEFVLATRVAKPWPGAKEPGESGHGTARRQPMRPPGVPDPREWGPEAGEAD